MITLNNWKITTDEWKYFNDKILQTDLSYRILDYLEYIDILTIQNKKIAKIFYGFQIFWEKTYCPKFWENIKKSVFYEIIELQSKKNHKLKENEKVFKVNAIFKKLNNFLLLEARTYKENVSLESFLLNEKFLQDANLCRFFMAIHNNYPNIFNIESINNLLEDANGFEKIRNLFLDNQDKLEEITALDLRNNILTLLPDEIGYLKNLQELDLHDNSLVFIPESIGHLKKLKKLYLSNNQLEKLPDAICNLSSLEELHLQRNKLSTLPQQIGQLNQLITLNISYNRLKELPIAIVNLSNLEKLCLQYNILAPENLKLPINLTELSIAKNNLRRLPQILGDLSKLTSLNLSNNQICELPEFFLNLQNLQILYLKSNNLQILPDWIGNLISLNNVELSNNLLIDLPQSFLNNNNLLVVNLSNNCLKKFPLFTTKNLFLFLANNPLEELTNLNNQNMLCGTFQKQNHESEMPASKKPVNRKRKREE